VGTDAGVLEDAPAFLTLEGDAGEVVGDRECGEPGDIRVVVVVDLAVDPLFALPDSVMPVGVGAVTGTNCEGDPEDRFDVERE